jgi:hypothetical protein
MFSGSDDQINAATCSSSIQRSGSANLPVAAALRPIRLARATPRL